ncbi:MAG: pantoate--beta-alanine ligase [Fimbriimonadaceae bacterium]|nr:MAG: pantoate--beta-alanine ligase [Fimbriimonadaceae bacterium]
MKVIRTIAEFRSQRESFGKLGFVPTMGALHQGHLSLMEQSAKENDTSAISIFVNPLQFGPNEDLSKYPRQESEDLEMASSVGVQVAFCPSVEEMLGRNATSVTVTGVSDLFEGEKRPGHFTGVATIVAQLFGIVQPNVAYFGLKDLQQCAVIRQMVDDLCIPVGLKFCETVREPSGLAMSSRNKYFSAGEFERASNLNRVIVACANEIAKDFKNKKSALNRALNELSNLEFEVQYLELVNSLTMQPVTEQELGQILSQRLSQVGGTSNPYRIIVAAQFCGVRLIDNVSLPIQSQN